MTDEMNWKMKPPVPTNRRKELDLVTIHGIELKPLPPEAIEALRQEMEQDGPIRGGLIPPPVDGCDHVWIDAGVYLFAESHAQVPLKKCGKCHVLGLPPKKGT